MGVMHWCRLNLPLWYAYVRCQPGSTDNFERCYEHAARLGRVQDLLMPSPPQAGHASWASAENFHSALFAPPTIMMLFSPACTQRFGLPQSLPGKQNIQKATSSPIIPSIDGQKVNGDCLEAYHSLQRQGSKDVACCYIDLTAAPESQRSLLGRPPSSVEISPLLPLQVKK